MGMFVVAPAASFNHYQHQHHEAINLASSDPINAPNGTTLGVGVGVIPWLTTAPCLTAQNMDGHDLLNNGGSRISGIQFWQQNHATSQYNNTTKKAMFDHHSHHNTTSPVNLLQSAGNNNDTGGGGGNSSSSGTTTCQDCGNQAKKDCTHRRCRTCCKSRGFECSTHVKSTWVPAMRRRERQLMTAAEAGGGGAGSSGATSGVKKPRVITSQQTATASHTSTSNTTPPRSFDTSCSYQDASFKESLPPQVRAPAIFKCVKVTAVDQGEDEYAYQTVVKINGHVFKGFLYDQGVEGREGFPNISELHLGGASSGGGANREGRDGATSPSPILDPSDVYGASGGGLLGDSGYGNGMN